MQYSLKHLACVAGASVFEGEERGGKVKYSRMTVPNIKKVILFPGKQRMGQWRERSGSTPGFDSICGLSLLLVLFLAPRGFSPGTLVFPSPQKPTFPNSNSARNQVNEEPLCGCANLQIFIYLFKVDEGPVITVIVFI